MAAITNGKYYWILLLNQALQMPNIMLLTRRSIAPTKCEGWREVPDSHPLDTSVERSHSCCLFIPNKEDLSCAVVWAAYHHSSLGMKYLNGALLCFFPTLRQFIQAQYEGYLSLVRLKIILTPPLPITFLKPLARSKRW